MTGIQEVLGPYGEAIRLIHEASLYLELAFRRTQSCLRTAQCELPLTTKHGDKLKASETFVVEGLERIYLIQETCGEMKKIIARIPTNGHDDDLNCT